VLNVFTPALGTGRRPVMVWLHGGGFSTGSGSTPILEGSSLAGTGDVVVVTINHRLNVFGYSYVGDAGGDQFALSGAAGMLDIIAALEWVRDNIDRFGGDPKNVTIHGESGGGSKVHVLLAMPGAKGLFQRAICQSGVIRRSATGLSVPDHAKATEETQKLFARLNHLLGSNKKETESVPEKARKTQVRLDVTGQTEPDHVRVDLNAIVPRSPGHFYNLGFYDLSDGLNLNVQAGQPLGSASLRYGMFNSRLGVGVDLGAPAHPTLALDLYGISHIRMDVGGRARLHKNFDLSIGMQSIFDRYAPYAGLTYHR